MASQNGNPAPSHEPDFNAELGKAQQTGDFDFVLQTAEASRNMLVDFRKAVSKSSYLGSDAGAVAQGLIFLDNMVQQANVQIQQLKHAAKTTKEALAAVPPSNG